MTVGSATTAGTAGTAPVVAALALRWLGRLSPRSPDSDADIATALGFLGSDVSAETVVRAGDGAAVLVAVLGLPGLVLVPSVALPAGVLALVAAAVGANYVVRAAPELLATARRTRALGTAPRLVSRAVLRMRIEPTAERAAAFAARGDGPLATSLQEHVHRARGTPRSGLGTFSDEWASRFPALGRAVVLLEAAAREPTAERDRALDRAREAVLDGTRERAASFAAGIRGPATAVYAFGVLLPLALVGVLPAARVAGLPVGLTTVVIVYDLLLPAGLAAATVGLLARRPVAFPPCRVPRSHPDVPDRRWLPVVAGLGTGLGAWLLAGLLLDGWTRPLASVGSGAGTALVVHYRPFRAVRDHVREVEAGLTDALALVGRRASNGTAVERAVEGAATDLDGAVVAVFAAATRRQRQLGVGIRAAFLGEHGALDDVPSPRARSAAALLAVAAHEGRPAGAAVVSMADHLDDLMAVEREARREIRRVTATLGNTAAVFAPLVGGATVALADAMAGAELGGNVSTAGMGTAVGAYVLVLAVLLTILATGLERGLDRALVGYRVGGALLAATAVYLVAFAGAGALT